MRRAWTDGKDGYCCDCKELKRRQGMKQGEHRKTCLLGNDAEYFERSSTFFLRTVLLNHTHTFLYSFLASSPKPKKTKKIIDDAGIVHQNKNTILKYSGGMPTIANRSTLEKLECTSAQLVQGRRPG
jgi:hypothetical protein